MKKTALMIMLLLCALFLNACYQDRDPWPASGSYDNVQTDVTLVPRTTATPMPTAVPTVPPTATPFATFAPTIPPMPDLWDDGPTEVPAGSVEPGFNG